MAWSELADMFNSFPGVVKRNSKQLMTYYKNLKRKANKNQANRRVELFKTGGGEKESEDNEKATSFEDRLLAMGVVKTPLVNSFDSDSAYHKLTTPITAIGNDENEEESLELDISYMEEVEDEPLTLSFSTLSGDISQETSQKPGQDGDKSPATNKETAEKCVSGSTKLYKLKRKKKRPVLSSALAAESLIKQSEKRQKFFDEQHEWDREKFLLEKELFEMKKEKNLLKINILTEQLKMYQVINEKIDEKDIQISLNINK